MVPKAYLVSVYLELNASWLLRNELQQAICLCALGTTVIIGSLCSATDLQYPATYQHMLTHLPNLYQDRYLQPDQKPALMSPPGPAAQWCVIRGNCEICCEVNVRILASVTATCLNLFKDTDLRWPATWMHIRCVAWDKFRIRDDVLHERQVCDGVCIGGRRQTRRSRAHTPT